jgi:hypothetical protein
MMTTKLMSIVMAIATLVLALVSAGLVVANVPKTPVVTNGAAGIDTMDAMRRAVDLPLQQVGDL